MKWTKAAGPADMKEHKDGARVVCFGEKKGKGSLLQPGSSRSLSVNICPSKKKNTVYHNHAGYQVSNSVLPLPRPLKVCPRGEASSRSAQELIVDLNRTRGLLAPFINKLLEVIQDLIAPYQQRLDFSITKMRFRCALDFSVV
jgi:hypothetical protein